MWVMFLSASAYEDGYLLLVIVGRGRLLEIKF